MRKVPELLAEQIEAADIMLLNKIDLAGPKQVEVAEALARSINDKAILEKVEFGKLLLPQQIVRDDKADQVVEEETKKESTDCCTDPGCTSHDHSHSHSHQSADAALDDTSTETTEASSSDGSSHSHSHSHSHGDNHVADMGIVNFVYRANRPFETRRLMSLLNTWPVPIKEDLEGLEHFTKDTAADDPEPAGRESPFFGVLRSKGFCWLAPTVWKENGGDPWRHDTAMYWSHAGKHFGITAAGKWWATVDEEQMKGYFTASPEEYERILKEDFVTEEWGDRRQELVFIGAGIDKEKITKALDDCLMSDKGMEEYINEVNSFMYL